MRSILLWCILLSSTAIFGQLTPGSPEFDCLEESSPICFSEETTLIGEQVCVMAVTQNYDTVAGIQFALEFDTALLLLQTVRYGEDSPIGEDDVNINLAGAGIVTVVHADADGVAIDIADGLVLFELCFLARAEGFAPIMVTDTLVGETLVWYDQETALPYSGNFGSITVLTCEDVTVDLEASICEGETFPFGGVAYTAAGTYTDTITTSLGCDSITILTLSVNTVTFELEDEIGFCPGDDVRIDAPEGFLLGLSSTSNDELQPSLILSPGSNEVKIQAVESGCVKLQTVNVVEFQVATIEFEGEPSYCVGEDGAEITVSGGVSFSWSNDLEDATVILTEGEYSVTATSADGCETVAEIEITEHQLPEVTITGDLTICNGEPDTELSASGAFTYLWNTEAETASIMAGPGEYSVTGTDENGCTATAEAIVEELPAVEATIEGSNRYCLVDEGVEITATGGTSFLWSTEEETATIFVAAGEYSVTVSNDEGCNDVATITVTQLATPNANIIGETVYCGQDGGTSITATGGDTYLWSTEEETATIFVPEGDYIVTVTNSEGCTSTASVRVNGETEAPEFLVCPPDIEVGLNFGQELAVANWQDPFVEDNCGPEGLVIENNFSSGDGFPAGETVVAYVATDASGNEENCDFTVTVTPSDELTFYVDSAAVTVEGDLFCIPIKVLNYNEVVGWSFAFELPAFDGAEYVSTTLGTELDALASEGAFITNNLANGQTSVLFANETGLGFTLEDGATALIFKIRLPGGAGDCFSITPEFNLVEVTAFREGPGFVVPTIIAGEACYPREIDILGRIYRCYDENRPVGATDVSIDDSDGGFDFDITDPAGRYSFLEQPFGLDFVVTPERDFDDREGLGLSDLITIIRHIQAVEFITDPCMQIAADVNNSGTINLGEIPAIQELIVGIINEFPENTSWRFFPVTHVFDGPALGADFPETAVLMNQRTDTIVDFYGVKVGDVDHSAIGQFQDEGDNPSFVVIPDETVAPNDYISVPVYYAAGQLPLIGYQQAWSFDPTKLEYLGLEAAVDKPFFVANESLTAKGSLLISWVDTKNGAMDKRPITTSDEVLFTMKFRAKTIGKLNQLLAPDEALLPSESARTGERNISSIQIEYRKPSVAGTFEVLPNPVTDRALVNMSFAQASRWQVVVSDIMGRQIKSFNGEALSGSTQLALPAGTFPRSGTYFLTLTTDKGEVISRKITKQ